MIDTDILIQQLNNSAELHSLLIQSSQHSGMVPSPNFDVTASRVLRAIADALMMATDNTEQER